MCISAFPERPCYSLPILTQRLHQCFVCSSQGLLKRSRSAWAHPAVCIHPPEVKGLVGLVQLAMLQAVEDWTFFGSTNVTWFRFNGNSDACLTFGGAVSLVGMLFTPLKMLFTCIKCHFVP